MAFIIGILRKAGNKMIKNYNKVCAYCETSFIAHDVRRMYCCDRCKDNASKVRHGIKPVIIKKKICKGCGKEFETQYSLKEYCHKGCRKKEIRIDSGYRDCIVCGENFYTIHNAKTCGNVKCKKEATRRRSINWTPRPKRKIVYETRECAECGEKFVIDSVMNNKCCSKECSKKRNNRKKDKRIPREQLIDSDISLKKLFKRDDGICWICGEKCDFESFNTSKKGNKVCGDLYPEIEHVIPISRGGFHSWDNVRLAHRKCNALKSDNIYPFVPLNYELAYKEKKEKTQAKKTAQFSLDGELIRIWESTGQIERELGLNSKHIQNVCRKAQSRTGNAYGYHWEYVND